MQKTHAGQSCPFGPRTMPGGTSGSVLLVLPGMEGEGSTEEEEEEEEEALSFLEERSTGWLLLLRLVPLLPLVPCLPESGLT